MSEKKFILGQSVVVVDSDEYPDFNGKVGKIVSLRYESDCGESMYGVEFDDDIDGHSCDGDCDSSRGWYLLASDLEGADEAITSLYKTKWVELCKRVSKENGTYIFIREPWLIDGKAVSVLPFSVIPSGEKLYLLRCEVADVPVAGTIKGGCDKEGEEAIETAVRELEEEAGFIADAIDMIPLGTARSSKLNTTIMHLFAVDVTGREQFEPEGDGTLNEANAYCMWVDEQTAIESLDPMIHSTMLRLKAKGVV